MTLYHLYVIFQDKKYHFMSDADPYFLKDLAKHVLKERFKFAAFQIQAEKPSTPFGMKCPSQYDFIVEYAKRSLYLEKIEPVEEGPIKTGPTWRAS